jgi:hypothetical protein
MDQPGIQSIPVATHVGDEIAGDSELISPDTVGEKLLDALTPSFQAEFDPEEAESAGAFPEDALSEDDALSSVHDFAHISPRPSPPKS